MNLFFGLSQVMFNQAQCASMESHDHIHHAKVDQR